MLEWMQDDAYSEAFVGHVVLILYVKFSETGCRDPATTIAVVGSTVLRTPRGEWKYRGNSAPYGPYGRLSLNSMKIPWFKDMSWFTDMLEAIG